MAAIDAALKAGEKILSIYEDPKSDFEIERKADNPPAQNTVTGSSDSSSSRSLR